MVSRDETKIWGKGLSQIECLGKLRKQSRCGRQPVFKFGRGSWEVRGVQHDFGSGSLAGSAQMCSKFSLNAQPINADDPVNPRESFV